MRFFILFSCAFFYMCKADERERRQSGLNGAHTDAMKQSDVGGFGGSFNPSLTPGLNGGRIGGAFGDKVWGSGSESIGLGAGVRADIGLSGGSPAIRNPEVGIGATYNNGPNSFSLGAGRGLGPSPSNSFGFTFSRQFRRSVDDLFANEEVLSRQRRQNNPALNAAVENALTNKDRGTPQFGYHVGAAGNSFRNFGAAGSAGVGMKVWESGRQSLGLGLGASGNLARVDGKTYTGNPQLGAGVGYQNGPFSAGLGFGRDMAGPARNNYVGATFGMRLP